MNPCQFRNINGNPCRHHTRPEFPVHYSPKLGIFLCSQHEAFIVQDHIIQFFKANINNLTSPITQYNTFSNSVYLRRLFENDLHQIPPNMNINECLFDFACYYREYNRLTIMTKFIVRNYENLIQIGSTNTINFNFSKLKSIYTPFHPQFTDMENISAFYDNYINNYVVMSYINNDSIHQSNIDLLTTQLMNFATVNYESNQVNVIEQERVIYENIPRQNPITHIDTNLEIDIKLTMIDYCHICSSDDLQKGLKMSCCNEDNKICAKCVIHNKLVCHNRYNTYYDIKDMDMFKINNQCFFCRKNITFLKLTTDNQCRTMFVEIIKEKIREESIQRERLLVENLNINLGL